jgi:hypothetical protein
MREFEQDLGAEWFLDLWELAPTPDKAMRIREASIAMILKKADAFVVSRPPTCFSASAHIRVLLERLRITKRV